MRLGWVALFLEATQGPSSFFLAAVLFLRVYGKQTDSVPHCLCSDHRKEEKLPFQGCGLEVTPITLSYNWPELSHIATRGCQGGWERSSPEVSNTCRMRENGCRKTSDSLAHIMLGEKGYTVDIALVLKG